MENNSTKRKEQYYVNEESQNFIDNVFIDTKATEEERLERYGQCGVCNEIKTYYSWCRTCNAAHFRNDFDKWTSDNKEIDYFIQNTQIHVRKSGLELEWYPWEGFSDIEKVGRGGYGTVFCAKRKVGRIKEWNYHTNTWSRQVINKDNEYVALKTIGDCELLSKDFLNEAKRLQRYAYNGTSTLYGFTKNETTRQYLLVLKYFQKGDLRKQLQNQATSWQQKIQMVWIIAIDMKNIHDAGMIHRDLHPGNVLLSSYDCYVGDLGLSVLESESGDIKEIRGVMPYLAPELLSGRGSYSRATDVYAFGMIMWEISSGEKPFPEMKHDKYLALRICQGHRPEITKGTPPFYRDLMVKCWHNDPSIRPSANEICALTDKWRNFDKCRQEIKDQINEAEEIRQRNIGIKKEMKTLHPGAIYTSRLLTNITRELASINLDDIEISDFILPEA